MRKTIGKSLGVALALLVIMAGVAGAAEPLYPIGTLKMEATSVAAGVGFTWGDGVLTFKGKEYKVKITGLNVAAVGISKIAATADVFNMKEASDLAGVYTAAGAGITVVGGVKGLLARNEKGVVLDLKATQEGVQLNLGVEGFTIAMK